MNNSNLRIVLVAVALLACGTIVGAQQAGKVYRIGYLLEGSTKGGARLIEAFRQGMREFGYAEGKDFVIEPRGGDGDDARLPALAAELVRLNVDLIVAAPTPPAIAVHRATRTIPIVVAHMSDPVEAGLVINLARPGGNVTGIRSLQAELAGKRVEMLKEAFPKISRVAVLGAGLNTNGGGSRQLRSMQGTAQALGLDLRPIDWKRPNPDFQRLSGAINEMRANAIAMTSGPWQLDFMKEILNLSLKNRLPMIYSNSNFTDAGGLMSYGPNLENFHRRAAYYVDKIMKGAKPAELPIEQPAKFELVINLKAAKQ